MTPPFSGGCTCGSIRYTCSGEPVAMLSCHCRDCQQSSGAAFASGVVVRVAEVQISGSPGTYSVRGASGGSTTRSFCTACGTPLFTRGELVPDLMSIRFTSLDDPSGFEPMVDIWTSSAQPWVHLSEHTPSIRNRRSADVRACRPATRSSRARVVTEPPPGIADPANGDAFPRRLAGAHEAGLSAGQSSSHRVMVEPVSQQLDELRGELLALASEDGRVRDELATGGSLFDGYHPRMEAVHRRNAARLMAAIDRHGWPSTSLVGPEAAEAAWLIAQHAIGEPDFLRRCLRLLESAANLGEVPGWQPAMLEDRIRMFEGRPQRYGTQPEPDEEGQLRPYPIEDPEQVEVRRRRVGLEPLSTRLSRAERVPMPADRVRFESEYRAWLRRVGWRQ